MNLLSSNNAVHLRVNRDGSLVVAQEQDDLGDVDLDLSDDLNINVQQAQAQAQFPVNVAPRAAPQNRNIVRIG